MAFVQCRQAWRMCTIDCQPQTAAFSCTDARHAAPPLPMVAIVTLLAWISVPHAQVLPLWTNTVRVRVES